MNFTIELARAKRTQGHCLAPLCSLASSIPYTVRSRMSQKKTESGQKKKKNGPKCIPIHQLTFKKVTRGEICYLEFLDLSDYSCALREIGMLILCTLCIRRVTHLSFILKIRINYQILKF